MGSDEKRYETSDGQKASLFTMVRVEPEWAASRIRAGEEAIAERDRLRRELEALRDDLEQRGARWLDMAPGQRPSVISEAVDVARRINAILTGEAEQ